MPIEVIERLNQLGKGQNQPTILTFQDRYGHSIMDPDPYFHPVDVDIKGVLKYPDIQIFKTKTTIMNTKKTLKMK